MTVAAHCCDQKLPSGLARGVSGPCRCRTWHRKSEVSREVAMLPAWAGCREACGRIVPILRSTRLIECLWEGWSVDKGSVYLWVA